MIIPECRIGSINSMMRCQPTLLSFSRKDSRVAIGINWACYPLNVANALVGLMPAQKEETPWQLNFFLASF
jgi:hypothetical protein